MDVPICSGAIMDNIFFLCLGLVVGHYGFKQLIAKAKGVLLDGKKEAKDE